MKEYKENATDFDRVTKETVYSGYACTQEETHYEWLWDERAKHFLPSPQQFEPAPAASMLCIEVLTPYSYELDLVAMQYQTGMSIFECDLFAVYSSLVIDLPGGLTTRKINSSQVAEVAGQWNTALNTDVFMALWRAVLLDGDYLKVSWIIKVDPDTVWFPSRLALLLRNHGYLESEPSDVDGISLLNCDLTFTTVHGPLEVFSRSALINFANHSEACFDGMRDWGDWQWGEDLWIDQCMQKFTKVKRVYEDQLIAEDHCHHWNGWRACDSERVAFHPFKDLKEHISCYTSALNFSSSAMLNFSTSTTSTITTVTHTTSTSAAPELPENDMSTVDE